MVENAAKPGFRAWLVSLAMAGLCLDGLAGEKIEIVGDGVQLPKKKSLLEQRGSFDVLTEKPDISGGGFAPPPLIVPGSAAQELLKEYDREKNWIYRDPRELDKRATGLEKLEKKEAANPLEPKQENQSVLERYLTEKNRRLKERRELERDNPQLERNDSRSRITGLNPFGEGSAFSGFEKRDREDEEFARELSLGAYLGRGTAPGATQSATDPYSRSYFNFQTPGGRVQLTPEQQLDAQKQEELRSETFQKLLQPRSITPSIAGMVDPITVGSDPSRQVANPIAPTRPDPFSFGRSAEQDGYNSPAFTANASRTSLPDLNRSSGLELPDIRAQQGSFSMTPPSSSPAPAAAAPAFNASSFTLEIPKRKF